MYNKTITANEYKTMEKDFLIIAIVCFALSVLFLVTTGISPFSVSPFVVGIISTMKSLAYRYYSEKEITEEKTKNE